MSKLPPFGILPALPMPLRDALRGVATLADAAEEALEPASALLPPRFRSRFHSALKSVERAGKRLITSPITMDNIETASQFLTGVDKSREARHACTMVLVFAWDHLSEAGVNHHFMVSESIIADRLSRLATTSNAQGSDFAAALIGDIRNSSAIGRMPGIARRIHATEATEVDVALLAIGTWLMSKRTDAMEEEEKLLELSLALVRALHADIPDLFGDQALLSGFLADTAAHL